MTWNQPLETHTKPHETKARNWHEIHTGARETTHCSPSNRVSELAWSFFVGPLSSAFFIAKLKVERKKNSTHDKN